MGDSMNKFIPNSFQVPNVLVDEYITKLSSQSFKLLLFIIRKTKGWQKTKDTISTTQLAKVVGLKMIRKVYPYIAELEALNLIKVHKSQGKTNQYSLGKNFDKVVPKKDTTQKETSTQKEQYPVPKKSSGTSTQKEHSTKDTIKTTNKKTIKEINKESLIELFFDDEKPLVEILLDHREQMKKPLETERAIRMLIKKIEHYAAEWEISLDDTVDFWLGENWMSIDVSYDYPFRARDRSGDDVPKKGTVDAMSEVKRQRIKSEVQELQQLRG